MKKESSEKLFIRTCIYEAKKDNDDEYIDDDVADDGEDDDDDDDDDEDNDGDNDDDDDDEDDDDDNDDDEDDDDEDEDDEDEDDDDDDVDKDDVSEISIKRFSSSSSSSSTSNVSMRARRGQHQDLNPCHVCKLDAPLFSNYYLFDLKAVANYKETGKKKMMDGGIQNFVVGFALGVYKVFQQPFLSSRQLETIQLMTRTMTMIFGE